MANEHLTINREAWNRLAGEGCEWTVPVGFDDLPRARGILDPTGWLPWTSMRRVLCLASGGGQQAVLFAYLGYEVTLVDLSPEQLNRDRITAERLGLRIELIEQDMQDLSALHGRDFDLVYQPVSAVYVPRISTVYQEVAKVLRPGGCYRVSHWNPIYTQMPERGEWDGEAYRIVYPQILQSTPIPQFTRMIGDREIAVTSWEFIHSLGELIGALCDAGFVITRFHEANPGDLQAAPTSPAHVAAFVPPMFTVLARMPAPPELTTGPF